MRNNSLVANSWWDYTTLDKEILDAAASMSVKDLEQLNREGFQIVMYDTLEEFYLAEALEYINTWMKSTADNPKGLCGPIGPTEQLPLVARIINDLKLNVKEGHFWAMDEWVENGKEVPVTHPLSFARANLELCFNRIDPSLRMPDENIHFLKADNIEKYTASYDSIKCEIMQGGQGDVKHWAFNDPFKREAPYDKAPPSPEVYRQLSARVIDLHPVTLMQNARTSGGGVVTGVPVKAITVGPIETWKSGEVSIWHSGTHDNPFGMRLTAFMISKKIIDTAVPMSILADHPSVKFNYYRPKIGDCRVEIH
ncbi:glucosamine-6-phosphate isomerase [Oceanispirochaeta crateris]|uniref:Glucosamine-6-phosphate isomerase n=1 Tax=Oceanispirochaeta crateris TaxID=2518645 RepID=A0A5C1QUX6_9SPIO|nr:glucosamine-6-phosphate isomerase [Oceanispirochaeta crateris]QEN09902.1 glucosamine-6-phosphate isomerase [Oceanispirochaeta crateris]